MTYLNRLVFASMFFLITSCSKPILTGNYVYYGQDSTNNLILGNDNTFKYSQDFLRVRGFDFVEASRRLGKGKFQVKNDTVILTFQPFRAVNSVDVIPIGSAELSAAEEILGIKASSAKDKDKILLNVYYTPFIFELRQRQLSNTVYDHKSILIFTKSGFRGIENRHSLLEFDKSDFPLELRFDFRHMEMGFFERVVNIQKPEDVKINIHLFDEFGKFDEDLYEEAFEGSKSFIIRRKKPLVIGNMVKTKK